MHWRAGLALRLMRRLGAVSAGYLDFRFLGRRVPWAPPERAPAEPILIGAAPARAVTDDQLLLLEHLQSFHCHVVDGVEKLGYLGGVKRTSMWVTLRPSLELKNRPGRPAVFYFDTFFAAAVSAAC